MHEVERECPEGAQSRREGASGRSSWFQGAADLMEMGGGEHFRHKERARLYGRDGSMSPECGAGKVLQRKRKSTFPSSSPLAANSE